MEAPIKSRGTALLLSLAGFIGFCGLHRIYLGRPISGIFQLLTAGLFGIWQLIDIILLLCNLLRDGEGRELGC